MRTRIQYTTDKTENDEFYQMPKFLLKGEFKKLSSDAKMLYMLIRDRHELSMKNGWRDKNNDVYLIMTREEMQDALELSKPTIIKAMNDLKDLKLIEEEHQGKNKPNLIYLLGPENLNSESKNFLLHEVNDFYLTKSKKLTSRGKNFLPHEVKNIDRNQTNQNQTYSNQTYRNNINRINQAESPHSTPSFPQDTVDIETIEAIKFQVSDKIGLDLLKERYPYSKEKIQEIFEIIVEILISSRTEFHIAKEYMSAHKVKQAFEALNILHIEYVLDCLGKNTTKVRNIKSYLITTLYNATKTIDNHYSQQVQHDLFQHYS